MGVNQLWQVLAPIKQHKSLDSLRGQMIAIDLSMWICESQSVRQMQGNVIKPFLRVLFFRVYHLLQLGINLVFVIDGCPPQIKNETIQKRLNPTQRNNDCDWKKRLSRTRFNAFLKECCCLLDCLGIPYLKSYGEAESYCAFLNAEGIADACLTDDGDAFLYGAKKIYRNFTLDSKDPHVESYEMEDIESQLKFNRSHLIAFALLVGCDYLPRGVPKIGVETTLKLFKALEGKDVLSRIQEWHLIKSSEISNSVEAFVRNKALTLSEFPHEEVIKEFLIPKDNLPKKELQWKRPNLDQFQEFAAEKLMWTEEYALKKIIPLLSKWTMLKVINESLPPNLEELFVPVKILKSQIKQGIPYFQVVWKISDTTNPENAKEHMSMDEQEIFQKSYPEIVEQYSKPQGSKIRSTKKGSKKQQEIKNKTLLPIDELSLDLEKFCINPLRTTEIDCGRKKSIEKNPMICTDHSSIQHNDSKSILPQTRDRKLLESNQILPIQSKTETFDCNFIFTPTSKNQQPNEFINLTNNERCSKVLALHDFSTDICQSPIDNNDKDIFSPIFHKLQNRYLLSKNKLETIVSNKKLSSFSNNLNPKNKDVESSYEFNLEGYSSFTTGDSKTENDKKFSLSLNEKSLNESKKSFSADGLNLEETKITNKRDESQSDISLELSNDIEMPDYFSFSKTDTDNLSVHNRPMTNEKLKNDSRNSVSTNALQPKYEKISFLNCTHSEPEENILLNISMKNSDSENLEGISSEKDKKVIKANPTYDKKQQCLLEKSVNAVNFENNGSILDNEIIIISDSFDEYFNEQNSLLFPSSLKTNDSKLMTKNSNGQDFLLDSSKNDSTLNAVENTSNTLHSFQENDFGQFEISSTFMNDSC